MNPVTKSQFGLVLSALSPVLAFLSVVSTQADTDLAAARELGGGGGSRLVIDGATRFQVMDGFGVNINVASWNDGELRPALDTLIDDLGATIFRVIIDNADWEQTNDDEDPGHYNWSYYDALDTGPKFEELWGTIAYLNEKGIDSRLLLSFMGPVPLWLGRNHIDPGVNGGRGNDEWVEMVASLVSHARNVVVTGAEFSFAAPPFSYFTLTNVPDTPPPEEAKFIRGDANRDRIVDIADVVRALFVLFRGFPSHCDDALDVTDDWRIDIADPIRLLGFLFLASSELAAPSPLEGGDPTPDNLSCDQ